MIVGATYLDVLEAPRGKVASSTATSSFEMAFSEWNAVVPNAAPPASRVLKL